ncbi:restriction endonuclease subunit S [Escherichia coli]|nr:restriction endonuclease subunit S [Escherichia coli]EHC2018094.1 restriction endonuclease subunit S [Escherichia coli]EKL6580200.1 restriction endonuclease subunit S [Escherichia coli]
MSELSYLEKLLDGVEVEWRNLGDTSLFEIANNGRKPVKASLRIAGETPYYGANNIQDYVDGYTHDGEYVLIAEDGSASLENYSIQYATGKFWANNHVHVVRGKERVHSRFLYHYLCIVNFLPFLTGGGRAKLTKGQLIEIPVPIPCPDNPEKSLAIQSEIVRILDKFTALTAELTAELTMRKKQYNYYRDQLLSFEEGEVEWKTLGDIGDVRMCKRILKNETLPEGDVPFYKIGTFGKKANAFISRDVFEAYKNKYSFPKKGDVLISASGTIGRTVIYDGEPAYFQDSNIVWLENDESIVTNKYLWHFYKIAKWAVSEGGTIDRLYNDNIRKTKIIVPYPSDPSKSLAEQNRVVAILEKFDALTSSISEGLPREIELRQKQYEYYRDLLFSFPKPEAASN